ncbi:TetR/AcrR family transcriptional regulator [uncultured Aeromicrobium sp.]|uniref:TetR/AcrR family transcriptional regulator n=1 Tax=uncultured Aeromicrobium sp. TaxID=337820 RepID=UPI0025EE8652|nr:TetR/AcrR family transcriptional regulator [uncultured Aeromicrobium sp.]
MARPSPVADRRGDILAATCAVVSERGFRDLRVADVARVAGCSSGTVHYYFASKDELLREAFRFQYEASVRRRESYVDPDDDPVTTLRKLADGYLPSSETTIESWLVWMELWVSALRDDTMSQINDVYYGEWRQAVLTAATEARDLGLLEVTDPLAFTDMYVSMMDGLAIQVLIRAEHMTVERMREICWAFVDSFVPAS